MSVTLQDICLLIVDCEHKTAPTSEGGFPMVRTPNIGTGRLLLEGALTVNEETYKEWTRRAIPQQGDLILAREAPVGNVAMVPVGVRPILGQRTVLLRPNPGLVSPRYLQYLLLGEQAQHRMSSVATGATVAHLNMRDIRSLRIPDLPTIETQKKIAAVLSAYDESIEVNLRRVKILRQMAQAIHRKWFVEFGYPGHGAARLVNSSFGMIPSDWELAAMSEVGEVTVGGDWGRDEPRDVTDARVAVIRGVDVRSLLRVGESDVSYRWVTKGSLERRLLAEQDLVIEASGDIGNALAYCERIGASIQSPVTYSNFCKRVRFPSHAYSLLFGQLLNALVESGGMRAYRTGTTIPNLNFSALSTHRFVVPPLGLLERFEEIVRPIDEMRFMGLNRNLQTSRDLLLPRLISGELDASGLDIETSWLAA